MTKIEWTEQTWNPIAGCSIVSPGCTNCYAMRMAARLEAMANVGLLDTSPLAHYRGLTEPSKAGPVWTGKLARAPESILTAPLRRRKPTMYFVNSMSDLFHEDVPDDWIDQVFAVMALCPQHTFQVLTKRSARMRGYFTDKTEKARELAIFHAAESIGEKMHPHDYGRRFDLQVRNPMCGCRDAIPLPNVWLGVSCEDQRRADERIPDLLATPAAVRFVSAEPLLGPVAFASIDKDDAIDGGAYTDALRGLRKRHMNDSDALTLNRLDWIIVGGESGPSARPMALGWAKDIVGQCQAAEVPVFVKQLGAKPTNREGEPCPHIKHPKGADMSEWPPELRVRQMPAERSGQQQSRDAAGSPQGSRIAP